MWQCLSSHGFPCCDCPLQLHIDIHRSDQRKLVRHEYSSKRRPIANGSRPDVSLSVLGGRFHQQEQHLTDELRSSSVLNLCYGKPVMFATPDHSPYSGLSGSASGDAGEFHSERDESMQSNEDKHCGRDRHRQYFWNATD